MEYRLLEILRELEISLHRAEVRSSSEQMANLLHPEFREFGRSGERYSREQVLAQVCRGAAHPVIWSQDFEVERLGERLALLTYRSAHLGANGELESHTNRSSLWQHGESGWKMRFHQGTPTIAFDKREH